MDESFLVALVAVTSSLAYLVGRRFLGLSRRGLRLATGRVLECAGMTAVFFLVNLLLGTSIILTVRAVTGMFISVYTIDDAVLLVLSLLQALWFVAWWDR